MIDRRAGIFGKVFTQREMQKLFISAKQGQVNCHVLPVYRPISFPLLTASTFILACIRVLTNLIFAIFYVLLKAYIYNILNYRTVFLYQYQQLM